MKQHAEAADDSIEDLRSDLSLDGDDVLRLSREGRGVVVVSDLHLGLSAPIGFPRELEPTLASLIAEAARRGDIVVLAGDILDAGARARDAVEILRRHPRLEEALAIAAETSELVYVRGNHDPPQHEIVKALKWRVGSRLLLDDDVLILHGDELDEGLRSTFVGRLGDLALRAQEATGSRNDGPATRGSLAARLLGGVTLEAALFADRHVQSGHASQFIDDNLNYLVSMEEERDPRFVLRALRSLRLLPSIRTVVCGHTHHPGIARVGDIQYANAGTWSARFATAVLISGHRCEVRDIVTGRTFGEEVYAGHDEPTSWRDFAERSGNAARLGPAVRQTVSTIVGRAGKVTGETRRNVRAVFGTLPRLTQHAPDRETPHEGDGDRDGVDSESAPFRVRFVERLTGVVRTLDAPDLDRAITIDLRAVFAPSDGERRATLDGSLALEGIADGAVTGTLSFEVSGGGALAYDLHFTGYDGAAHRLFGRKLVRFSELGRSLTELPAALTRAGQRFGEAELVFDARRELGSFVRSIAISSPRVRSVARNPARWADVAGRRIDPVALGARRRVLVTGATGHLGHNLVAQLLARGHHVTAVVRRLGEEARVLPLRTLSANSGKGDLAIVEADLLSPAAVRRAFESAPDLVFHTASAFELVGTDEQRTVVEPTVLATVHVLREAARIGVSRAILTSSAAALGTDATGRDPLNEGDWNHDAENAYHRAKTLAEKRAWEIAKTDNLDLVVVNPSSFLGPNFFRHTPTTRVLADLVAGRAPVIPPFDLSWVDVRDVAWAHVLAAENANANGRYVVSTAHLSFAELVERFLLIDPHVAVPTRLTPAVLAPLTPAFEWVRSKFFGVPRSISTSLAKDLSGKAMRVSSARAERELSWSPIDLEVSLRDTLSWLREQYES